MGTPLQIATVTLQALGFILLSLLLFTIQSKGENDRHPLFINFLVTWVMFSAFTTYYLLGTLVVPGLDPSSESGYLAIIKTQYEIFMLMPLVSTLNLVIHLSLMTWNGLNRESKFLNTSRYWTPILLATPYLTGLIPLLTLWSLISDTTVGYISLILMVLTTLLDVSLLCMLFFHRLLRKAVILLVKILVFALLQTTISAVTIVFGVTLKHFQHEPSDQPTSLQLENVGNIILLSQAFYPLLVFVLFGLRRDLLQSWFPCIPLLKHRPATDPMWTGTVSGAFTSNGQIV